MENPTILHLENKLDELNTIQLFLDEMSEAWNIPMPLAMSLNLVLEEAFTNVVNYAFEDNLLHIIDLRFLKENDDLVIVLSDDGKPYDPTAAQDPDTTLSVEDRAIGGLGIFLIRQIMDEVSYRYEGGKNFLLMKKKLN